MKLVFSDDLRRYYSKTMTIILQSLKDGQPQYTHHFRFLESLRSYHLDAMKIKQCLRTLEHDGLVENINLGFNIHQWKITEKGIQSLDLIK